MQNLKAKLLSRKFWAAVASALLIVFNDGLGWNIPQEAYWQLVALALGYIFGEAVVDCTKQKP